MRKTNARVKFLSLEPLIGELPNLNLKNIDWVIVGGESGHNPRPMDADWVIDIQEQCEKAGIWQPIYPGIMPITNFKNLARFSAGCGADIPRWMSKRLESYGDDQASITAFGIEMISELCQTLLENSAPGLHFYTMNQIEPNVTILKNLGLAE